MTVAPDRIAAVTFLARDPTLSVVADRAVDLPVTPGDMESIAALRPDLVLAGPHGARAAGRLMQARGVPVVRIGLAADFDDIREQIRAVAAAVEEPAAGERLVKQLDDALDALPAAPENRPSA
ncbi:MAG: ABC transporter substrate-binding protein, partial [Acetobacterales bacterium]